MAQPFPNELEHLYDEAEFIGSGGFAQVFKARRKDSRVVAVKIPLKLDEVTGKSFLREITSWQRLNHRNIVSLFDANILPIPYLEQEYMDGGNLEGIKKPLEIVKACEIVFEIAEGLKYAHKQGIVHRDLKPQNVLLTKDNVPKITDWGMSRVVDAFKSSTQQGFTPVYAAPEQVSPKKFGNTDKRTDIYQLGVILYNLITNDLPFKGDDLVEIASAIVMEEPIPLSKSNPEAWEVEPIVLRCLSKKKEDRYQSVEELQEKLFEPIKKERERKEGERKAKEEQERQRKQKGEEERAKKEREEQERLQRKEEERKERERKAKEEQERQRKQREEEERAKKEKEEQERLRRIEEERKEGERKAKEEQERQCKQKEEEERAKKEREEQERLRRIEEERKERERKIKEEQERHRKQREEEERAKNEREEQERLRRIEGERKERGRKAIEKNERKEREEAERREKESLKRQIGEAKTRKRDEPVANSIKFFIF
jgi:serine/threonine protein kinase